MQEAAVNYFRLSYPKLAQELAAIPNGGFRDHNTAKVLKKEGVVRGFADLQLIIPNKRYHGLFLEAKIPPNKQSKHQREFQQRVESRGYLYKVFTTPTEMMNIITHYLNDNL